MNKIIKFSALSLVLVLFITAAACGVVDENYGVSSEESSYIETPNNPIMSSDKVMPKYFDIMLFDEENYSDIYLGKRFKIKAEYLDKELKVSATLKQMEEMGWTLAEENVYTKNSRLMAYETVDVIFQNADGVKIKALMYNKKGKLVDFEDCSVVKIFIDNNFYTEPENVRNFNINGITNSMAITDIIETLGTPSHFYAVSEECYYLDYFISKDDRRNGITVYINPVNDSVISVEFSSYK